MTFEPPEAINNTFITQNLKTPAVDGFFKVSKHIRLFECVSGKKAQNYTCHDDDKRNRKFQNSCSWLMTALTDKIRPVGRSRKASVSHWISQNFGLIPHVVTWPWLRPQDELHFQRSSSVTERSQLSFVKAEVWHSSADSIPFNY